MRRVLGRSFAALLAVLLAGHLVPAKPLRGAIDLPSRIYSRPLVLVEGATASRDELRAHLKASGYRGRSKGALAPGEYRLSDERWLVGRRAFEWPDGHDAGGLLEVKLAQGGRVRSLRDAGRPVSSVALEPVLLGKSLGAAGEDREWIALEQTPRPIIASVLAAEDQRFYWHPGIDPIRIAGAALANLRSRRITQGASTITQQLAKNAYLGSERTWARKLAEVGIAAWLELRHTKDEILEAYLNQVYLAQDGGRAIHGVEVGSQHFFGRPAAELDWHQAALLAAVIRSPNRLSPHRHPARARAARDRVLEALAADAVIDGAQLAHATARPLGVRAPAPVRSHALHFRRQVERRVAAEVGDPGAAGVRVFTTLDPALQRAAEAAVRGGLDALERGRLRLRRRGAGRELQAALVVLDPRTGDVLAHVGARDASRSPFDRAIAARRQPGSVFKPIVALAAFTSRDRPAYTLATVLEDAPLSVPVEEGDWKPRNIDSAHRGPVTLRQALEQSRNVPFARLGMELGLVRVADLARALGIAGPLRPVPSLSLGAFEVSPLEMTGVYAALANGGVWSAPRMTLAALDPAGRLADREPVRSRRVADPIASFLVTSALRGAVERGTAAALRRLGVSGPWAAKTGTTNGDRDAWFLAYTAELAVGIWVGFDDAAPLGVTGAEAALPLFARFAKGPLPPGALRPVVPPAGSVQAAVEAIPGLGASDEWFRAGTAPRPRLRDSGWGRWLARLGPQKSAPR